MADDEEEQDPNAYESSWAGATDRMLYGAGWLVAIFFVISTCFYCIGFPTEVAANIALKIVGVCALPVLLYYVRN